MAEMENPFDVEVGQVWADNDKREAGREVTVVAVDLEVGKATVEVTKPRRGSLDVTAGKRRQTKISLGRFQPTTTGYRRIS